MRATQFTAAVSGLVLGAAAQAAEPPKTEQPPKSVLVTLTPDIIRNCFGAIAGKQSVTPIGVHGDIKCRVMPAISTITRNNNGHVSTTSSLSIKTAMAMAGNESIELSQDGLIYSVTYTQKGPDGYIFTGERAIDETSFSAARVTFNNGAVAEPTPETTLRVEALTEVIEQEAYAAAPFLLERSPQ